ncbi:hypothetical protein GALL_35880 [mine drainage metagenome]|uniref:Uncharacterized protein n=1 Tax=mine drainage metagenome TaxID=410659 RepID=A0A1J5T7I4_9ZZZZ
MKYNAADKYRSMLRSFERIKRINTDNGNTISNTDARDATEDFFTQCYHFKDWLKKDSTLTLSQNVEKFINASNALSLAADYCNSFKHAGLDSQPRSGQTLEGINTHMRMDLTPKGFVMSSSLELTISGKKHDAFELAKRCIEEWDLFLISNKIVFPES